MKEKNMNFGLERSTQAKVTIKNTKYLEKNDITVREVVKNEDTGTVVTIKYLNEKTADISVLSEKPQHFSFEIPFTGWFDEQGEFVVVSSMGDNLDN